VKNLTTLASEGAKKATYWAKEHSGNYHSAELAVQRGYSCSKHTMSPRLPAAASGTQSSNFRGALTSGLPLGHNTLSGDPERI